MIEATVAAAMATGPRCFVCVCLPTMCLLAPLRAVLVGVHWSTCRHRADMSVLLGLPWVGGGERWKLLGTRRKSL